MEVCEHVSNTELAAGPVAGAVAPQISLHDNHFGLIVPVEEVVDILISNLDLDLGQLVKVIPGVRASSRYETDFGQHYDGVYDYSKGLAIFQFF